MVELKDPTIISSLFLEAFDQPLIVAAYSLTVIFLYSYSIVFKSFDNAFVRYLSSSRWVKIC
jgi:hypothetical protein